MIHKSRTVTTHNLAKQDSKPTELIATEEVPSKNKNNQKHFVIFRSSSVSLLLFLFAKVRTWFHSNVQFYSKSVYFSHHHSFFASLGDVILQLYVGTKNGWSQTSEKEKHFSYRWNIFAKEELGLGAPTTKATYYSSHAQAVDISLITHPLLASFGRKSISKGMFRPLLFYIYAVLLRRKSATFSLSLWIARKHFSDTIFEKGYFVKSCR